LAVDVRCDGRFGIFGVSIDEKTDWNSAVSNLRIFDYFDISFEHS